MGSGILIPPGVDVTPEGATTDDIAAVGQTPETPAEGHAPPALKMKFSVTCTFDPVGGYSYQIGYEPDAANPNLLFMLTAFQAAVVMTDQKIKAGMLGQMKAIAEQNAQADAMVKRMLAERRGR